MYNVKKGTGHDIGVNLPTYHGTKTHRYPDLFLVARREYLSHLNPNILWRDLDAVYRLAKAVFNISMGKYPPIP